jgi:hypothetical protein
LHSTGEKAHVNRKRNAGAPLLFCPKDRSFLAASVKCLYDKAPSGAGVAIECFTETGTIGSYKEHIGIIDSDSIFTFDIKAIVIVNLIIVIKNDKFIRRDRNL